MLCVCLSISCRFALSQTRRKARVRRCSLLFDPPGRTHLPGTSRHRQLLLIRIGGSLALLFRPPLMDILPMYVLFSFLTPAAFWAAQRWGWKTVLFVSFSAWFIAQTHVRDMLVNTSKDLSFVQLGPFDLLAWQFLWVGGLFIGQRFLENKSLLPMPRLLRPLLVLSAIAFLFWRWSSITSGPDPITQTWLFDKWDLGPLRLTRLRGFEGYVNRKSFKINPSA